MSDQAPGDYWDIRERIPDVMSPSTVFESELSEKLKEAATIGTIRNRRFTDPHTRITVSPSEVADCIRKTVLMRHYKVPPLTYPQMKGYAEMERMAAEGNTLHDQAMEALQSQGIAIVAELRLEDADIPSTMRLDGFYEAVDDDDVSYILEIKTMGQQQFSQAVQNMMPRAKDLIQLQYYMDVKQVELGMLMIIDRTFGGLDVMTVMYDEGIINHVYERFEAIRAADETHIVMARPFKPNYWLCQKKSCVMHDICKDIGPEEATMECASE